MFMFICVEDGLISSVVSFGIPVRVALSVTAHGIPGSVASTPSAVAYVFTNVNSDSSVRFYVGSAIYFLKNLD